MDADDTAPPQSSPVPRLTEPLLLQCLEESRRLGFLGSRPIDEVVAHARHFVGALAFPAVSGPPDRRPTVLDLGAGGGLPGLVIAHDLPGVRLAMLDRRRTRTDFLARVVRRLEWNDRVEVLTQDAVRPTAEQRDSFDAVVAHGFGPPESTLRIAARWTRSGGMIVISEPPRGDRWSAIDLSAFDVERIAAPSPQVAVFRRR